MVQYIIHPLLKTSKAPGSRRPHHQSEHSPSPLKIILAAQEAVTIAGLTRENLLPHKRSPRDTGPDIMLFPPRVNRRVDYVIDKH